MAARKISARKAAGNTPKDGWIPPTWDHLQDLATLSESCDYSVEMIRKLFAQEMFEAVGPDNEHMAAACFSMLKDAEASTKKLETALYKLLHKPEGGAA